jgi:hypothetical protein
LSFGELFAESMAAAAAAADLSAGWLLFATNKSSSGRATDGSGRQANATDSH